jgi:hypothetical protein
MIEQLLQCNQQLCKRLRNLEDAFDARSTITKQLDNFSFISQADDTAISIARPTADQRVSILEVIKVRFAFDDDLKSSRVYRMAKHDSCNYSLVNSVTRTQTWSIFSGLSLADISIISVVALPLYPEDVHDHSDYYTFGGIAPAAESETTATWTSKQEMVDAIHQPLHEPSSQNDVEDADLSSIDETHSVGSSASSPLTTHVSGSTSATTAIDDILRQLESRYSGFPVHESKVCQKNVDTQENLFTPLDNDNIDANDEEDNFVNLCKGCGEMLKEGKAFELGRQLQRQL